ncbi:collagen alpha-1(I) chain-like [Poecile atricapillus]|uniref:collagen alpha-1(I) chain-like n=1 Tax=Poecile atricapillus TaxID=48891 RepID=UPI0027397DA9|nr:collagen alpha-1(I) chain-like [Poecile atricapillus]XP_058712762.1 collagen alpha-1(I) chain-like [Poecile atricapillus]XP_058712763.1 collagen alpha-1(I) chain-like [Poecile atricapillus]
MLPARDLGVSSKGHLGPRCHSPAAVLLSLPLLCAVSPRTGGARQGEKRCQRQILTSLNWGNPGISARAGMLGAEWGSSGRGSGGLAVGGDLGFSSGGSWRSSGGCSRPGGTWHHERDGSHGPALAPGIPAIPAPGSAPGGWIPLCSITDFQLSSQSACTDFFPWLFVPSLAAPRGRGFGHRAVVPAGESWWCRDGRKHLEHLHARPPHRLGGAGGSWVSWKFSTSLLGRAGVGRRGSSGTQGPGGGTSPGSRSVPGRFSCLCSPEFRVPALIPVLGQGWEPPPLPVLSRCQQAGGGEGAGAGRRGAGAAVSRGAPGMAQPGMRLVAPGWRPVTAHGAPHSSLGFP